MQKEFALKMFHCSQWFTWKKVVPVQEAELVAEVVRLWPYLLGAWLTQTHQLSVVHLHQYQLVTCTVLIAIIIRTKYHNHSSDSWKFSQLKQWNNFENTEFLWNYLSKMITVIWIVDEIKYSFVYNVLLCRSKMF